MLQNAFILRNRLKGLVAPPSSVGGSHVTWKLEVSASAINEGAVSPTITITRALGGDAHQDCSIRFNTASVEEFATLFPGELQAQAQAWSDFTTWVEPPLKAACLAAGIGYFLDTINNDFVLSWTSGSPASVSFTRQSIVHSGAEGDRRSVYKLYDPSIGALYSQSILLSHTVMLADFVIHDTDVAADLVLNAVTRPYTLCRTAAVAGETVFSISAFSGTISAVTLTNNEGGRFAVGTPSGGIYPIITTSTPCDFEGSSTTSRGATYGIYRYRPVVHVVGSLGQVVDLVQDVYARYAQIAVTGNTSGSTPVSVTDSTSLVAAFKTGTSNRTHTVSPAYTGIWKNGGFQLYSLANNTTFNGNPALGIRNGRSEEINGKNRIIRDQTILTTKYLAATIGGDLVRGMMIGEVSSLANQTTDIWIENCSIALTVDQILDVYNDQNFGPFVRRLVFYKCLFAEPMYSGHPHGPHPFGPLAFRYHAQVLFIDCAFLGFKQRVPALDIVRGALVQNCVMAYYATQSGDGCITFQGPNWDVTSDGCSANLRGNLIHPHLSPSCLRSRAIFVFDVGSGARINANFDNPPYENHYIGQGPEAPHFESDPLSLAGSVTVESSGGSASSTAGFVNWDPFQLDYDYGYIPTTSQANRQAVFDRTMDYCGARKRVGGAYPGALIPGDDALPGFFRDAMMNYRATGTTRTFDYPPNGPNETVDFYYGTELDGVGGSLGHSAVVMQP